MAFVPITIWPLITFTQAENIIVLAPGGMVKSWYTPDSVPLALNGAEISSAL
jgi:hypothetical protein